MITHRCLANMERTDADVHHGQAEVEVPPTGQSDQFFAPYTNAPISELEGAGKHKARVLLHIRFGGERTSMSGRLEQPKLNQVTHTAIRPDPKWTPSAPNAHRRPPA